MAYNRGCARHQVVKGIWKRYCYSSEGVNQLPIVVTMSLRAKRSNLVGKHLQRDCVVAALLAMTVSRLFHSFSVMFFHSKYFFYRLIKRFLHWLSRSYNHFLLYGYDQPMPGEEGVWISPDGFPQSAFDTISRDGIAYLAPHAKTDARFLS